jgi:CheY-like chemotaxis protein
MSAAVPTTFRPRVFIIEDEYFLADDLARQFSDLGADIVGFAPSASKALGILGRMPPIDVAVLDVWLLDGDVFEVADLLHEKGACIVFYTALNSAELPERFRSMARVEKPSSAQRVYDEVVRACSPVANC